jgi:hypothetical protein
MGFRTVWDIRESQDESATHGYIDGAVAVDGNLYLKWMPEDLVNATLDYRRKEGDPAKINEDTYKARLKSRKPYRVMGKGRPDEDGYFRFYYPPIDSRKHLYVDPATDKEVRFPKLAKKTLTVGPDSPENLRIIKFLQMFEYRSDEWHAWAGLRNRVEENNWWMKHEGFGDLGNPRARRPRGYAYQGFVAAMVATVGNMRRIVKFIETQHFECSARPPCESGDGTTPKATRCHTRSNRCPEPNTKPRSPRRGATRVGAVRADPRLRLFRLGSAQKTANRPEKISPAGSLVGFANIRDAIYLHIRRCARGELNPHVLSDTGT